MSSAVAWLFCPADRPSRFEKAAGAADVVILDLEDGVAAANRPAARDALRQTKLDPTRTVVRINPYGTPDHRRDLIALRQTDYRQVMLAKTESPEQLSQLTQYNVVALCETPKGVLNAPSIAGSSNVVAVMWGAEDLVASLGGRASRFHDGQYRDVARHARSAVLLAAGSAGKTAVDSVYLAISDMDGLAGEAADAVSVGFAAKACIHPSQVPVIKKAFVPTAIELAWAIRVLKASEEGVGVFLLDGVMVDEPVIRQARAIIERAG